MGCTCVGLELVILVVVEDLFVFGLLGLSLGEPRLVDS
jgi:hypothetical protein